MIRFLKRGRAGAPPAESPAAAGPHPTADGIIRLINARKAGTAPKKPVLARLQGPMPKTQAALRAMSEVPVRGGFVHVQTSSRRDAAVINVRGVEACALSSAVDGDGIEIEIPTKDGESATRTFRSGEDAAAAEAIKAAVAAVVRALDPARLPAASAPDAADVVQRVRARRAALVAGAKLCRDSYRDARRGVKPLRDAVAALGAAGFALCDGSRLAIGAEEQDGVLVTIVAPAEGGSVFERLATVGPRGDAGHEVELLDVEDLRVLERVRIAPADLAVRIVRHAVAQGLVPGPKTVEEADAAGAFGEEIAAELRPAYVRRAAHHAALERATSHAFAFRRAFSRLNGEFERLEAAGVAYEGRRLSCLSADETAPEAPTSREEYDAPVMPASVELVVGMTILSIRPEETDAGADGFRVRFPPAPELDGVHPLAEADAVSDRILTRLSEFDLELG